MSYGTKYRLIYDDNFSQTVQVDLKKDGYSGSVTTFKGAGSPLIINHDAPDDFLFSPILGTWVTFRILVQTTFAYSDLFTTDPKEWMMTVDIDSVNYFTGYLMPNLFDHTYKNAPYILEVIASDQLGVLKDITFPSFNKFENKTPQQILEKILELTGLDFNMRESINLFEDSMTSGAAYSPINQCYIDLEAYEDNDGEPIDCYSVLKDLLLNFTACIRQVNGEWHIWRPSEAIGSYDRRLWTWNATTKTFTYTSTASHDPTVATTASGVARSNLVRILNMGDLMMLDAWKEYQFIQSYKIREEILYNADFKDWLSVTIPKYWTVNGGISITQSEKRAEFTTIATFSSSKYIMQIVPALDKNSNQRIKLHLKFTCQNATTLYIQLKLYGSSIYFFDDVNGVWTTAPTYLEIVTSGQWEDYDIEIITPVINVGTSDYSGLWCYFFEPVSAALTKVYLDKFSLTFAKLYSTGIIPYDEGIDEKITINADNSLKGETVEILSGDIPVVDNPKYVYKSGIYLDSSRTNPTDLWTDSGMSASYPLREIIQQLIGLQYGHSAEMLTVEILTKNLDGDNTIQITEHNGKKYFPHRIEWDQKHGRMRYEMIEILCSLGYLEKEDGDFLLLETGDKIIL